MTIVEAGARRDLGELDAALRTLENAPLRSRTRAPWVVRLRYAYADTLLAAGRRRTPWSGSTAPPVSTARGSPTRPSGSARSRGSWSPTPPTGEHELSED